MGLRYALCRRESFRCPWTSLTMHTRDVEDHNGQRSLHGACVGRPVGSHNKVVDRGTVAFVKSIAARKHEGESRETTTFGKTLS